MLSNIIRCFIKTETIDQLKSFVIFLVVYNSFSSFFFPFMHSITMDTILTDDEEHVEAIIK